MKNLELDAIDIRILSAIQQHGKLSKTRLAEIVNLSPTPCLTRLGRLSAAGYIQGYRGIVALDLISDATQVYVTVALAAHRKLDFDRFETRILALDEITECVATGGGMDYVMKVICPSISTFQELMEGLLEEELGIQRYMTYVVTREVKSEPPNLSKLNINRHN